MNHIGSTSFSLHRESRRGRGRRGRRGLGLARLQPSTCTVVFYEELGEDNALHVFLVH